jgi:hypothetical protein
MRILSDTKAIARKIPIAIPNHKTVSRIDNGSCIILFGSKRLQIISGYVSSATCIIFRQNSNKFQTCQDFGLHYFSPVDIQIEQSITRGMSPGAEDFSNFTIPT